MAKQNVVGFPIPFGIQSPNKMYSADAYAGPYNSVQDAMDTVEEPIRIIGRPVGIYRSDNKGVDIYHFEKDSSNEWILVLANASGIADAPSDGQEYVRKDNQWHLFVGGSDKTYLYEQNTPSDTWEINHNLGKHVSVEVIDSSGQLVEGEVTYNSLNKVTIRFNGSFTGVATCN